MPITGIEILTGVMGNAATAIIAGIYARFSAAHHERDEIINKAFQAIDRAYGTFMERYPEKYQPPAKSKTKRLLGRKKENHRHDSFLAREENVERLLQRIFPHNETGQYKPLNPEGFGDFPAATDEEVQCLIELVEREFGKVRELAKELADNRSRDAISKIDLRTNEIKGDIENVKEGIEAIKSKDAQPETVNADHGLLTPLPLASSGFIGRKKDLTALKKSLDKSAQVLLVNGIGGIGKTEVCKAFFRQHYASFRHAAWVDYYSSIKESMVQAFDVPGSPLLENAGTDMAAGSLDERFERIMAALNRLNRDSLLVLDNLDNPKDPDLKRLQRLPFKVIANSRVTMDGFLVHRLDYLPISECRRLFYVHYDGPKNDTIVNRIITLCHSHTLTVELLARTARNSGKSPEWLERELRERGFNLGRVLTNDVGTSWHDESSKPFFDHLLMVFDLADVPREDRELLSVISVLPDMVPIPMDTLKNWLKLASTDPINRLANTGWLRRETPQVFIHPVIGEVIRFKTNPSVERCHALILSLAWELKLESGDNPLEKKGTVIFARVVLDRLYRKDLQFDPEQDNKPHDHLAALANNLSTIYKALGQLEQALQYSRQAVEILESLFPDGHPNLDIMRGNLESIITQASAS